MSANRRSVTYPTAGPRVVQAWVSDVDGRLVVSTADLTQHSAWSRLPRC